MRDRSSRFYSSHSEENKKQQQHKRNRCASATGLESLIRVSHLKFRNSSEELLCAIFFFSFPLSLCIGTSSYDSSALGIYIYFFSFFSSLHYTVVLLNRV